MNDIVKYACMVWHDMEHSIRCQYDSPRALTTNQENFFPPSLITHDHPDHKHHYTRASTQLLRTWRPQYSTDPALFHMTIPIIILHITAAISARTHKHHKPSILPTTTHTPVTHPQNNKLLPYAQQPYHSSYSSPQPSDPLHSP